MHVQLCQRSKAAESGRNGARELVPTERPAPTAGDDVVSCLIMRPRVVAPACART